MVAARASRARHARHWCAGIPEQVRGSLWVNGVDVVPLVEIELNRRLSDREPKTATTPDGRRTAWVEVLSTAAGREDVSVDGEWSLSQTLRHLVLATNA